MTEAANTGIVIIMVHMIFTDNKIMLGTDRIADFGVMAVDVERQIVSNHHKKQCENKKY